MKKKLFTFLRLALSFGLLGLLFWFMRGKVRHIWGTISGCNIGFLGLGIMVILMDVLVMGARLRTVFKGENLHISFKRAFQLTCVGYYFNNFMPTSMGGDVIKAHYASSIDSKDRIRSYASVFMDRFIGLYAILIISACALIVDRGRLEISGIRSLITILIAVGIISFVVVTNKGIAAKVERFFLKFKKFNIGESLNRLYGIVHDYRNRKGIIAKALLMSLTAQTLYFLTAYLFFLALGASISLGNIFLLMPVVMFISMVPSLGGLGFREGATVVLFAPFVGKEIAFAVSLLMLGALFFISIIGGGIYLVWSVKGEK